MKTFRSLKIAAAIGAITTGMNSWGYPIYILTFDDAKAHHPNQFLHGIAYVEHELAQPDARSAFSEVTFKTPAITLKDASAQGSFVQGTMSSMHDSFAENAVIGIRPMWLNSLPPFSGNARKNLGQERAKPVSARNIAAADDLIVDLKSNFDEHLIKNTQSSIPSDHKISRDWVASASRNLPTNISQGSGNRPAQVVASTDNQKPSAPSAVVSEPGTLNLIGMGAVGLAITRRFAKSKQKLH